MFAQIDRNLDDLPSDVEEEMSEGFSGELDELIVHGSPQRCRERLAEYTAAGATTLALSVLPGELDPIDAARSIALR